MKTVTPQAGSATSTTTSSKAPLLRRASAVAITLAATAVVLLLSAGAASAQIQNPIDGVKPDLSVFGPAFNNVWVRVIGGIWAVALGASTVKLIFALYKMRSMKAAGMPQEMSDASGEARIAGIAFGCLASVGIITGAILFLVGG
ncbi:hypothetical protein [Rhodococcus sp. UFZ-B548]|uniref:hypothetical protein n=1 Tax=Rhodococcus sp. UFZ-B548 TaxID=2742212 RepID=UPI002174DC1C|nr:hypothetical protein [Rhodococcus sp. UFZ-B548]